MKTLDEHNTAVWERRESHNFSGILCPKCKEELWVRNLEPAYGPRLDVTCPKCFFDGVMEV